MYLYISLRTGTYLYIYVFTVFAYQCPNWYETRSVPQRAHCPRPIVKPNCLSPEHLRRSIPNWFEAQLIRKRAHFPRPIVVDTVYSRPQVSHKACETSEKCQRVLSPLLFSRGPKERSFFVYIHIHLHDLRPHKHPPALKEMG